MSVLTPEAVRAALDYDPETGRLTWRVREMPKRRGSATWNVRYAGKEAFTFVTRKGYRYGTVLNQRLMAHRVIWFMVHGRWPNQVDHINGDRQDNRLCNLREVDNRTNCRNRTQRRSLPLGIYRSKNGKRWVACLGNTRDKGSTHLGTFDTLNEAVAARKDAERREGYHPNHGRAA